MRSFFKNCYYFFFNIAYLFFLNRKMPISSIINGSDNQLVVAVIAFNNPQVVSVQLKLFKKFNHNNIDFLICDNSSDKTASRKIFKICKINKISYIKLPLNPYTNFANGSYSHGAAMNYVYKNFLTNSSYEFFGFLDHDIFPISNIEILKIISSLPYYGLKQSRKNKVYLWVGYCFFNKKYIKNKKLDFRPTTGLDTGGRLYETVYKDTSSIDNFSSHSYSNSSETAYKHNQGYEIIDKNWFHTSHIKNYNMKTNQDYILNLLENDFLEGKKILTIPVSVLISIYKNDNPDYFAIALESIFEQTAKPSEVVLVKDGPLSKELEKILAIYAEKHKIFKIVKLKENQGLGKALNQGLQHCSYDIIARMDSDDICKINRFEKQYNFLINNPNIDICGSWVEEFTGTPNNILSIKKVPEKHSQIKKYAKFRNPMNHPTVMFRKDAVLTVGNYQHFYLYEDYYLWIKMLMANKKFHNIQESLLYFRSGLEMHKRRRGMKYAKSEAKLYKTFYKLSFISRPFLFFIISIRLPFRLLPASIVKIIYNIIRNF